MYMKHPETGGVAECSEDQFNLLHKSKGWVEAAQQEFDDYTNGQREAVLVDEEVVPNSDVDKAGEVPNKPGAPKPAEKPVDPPKI